MIVAIIDYAAIISNYHRTDKKTKFNNDLLVYIIVNYGTFPDRLIVVHDNVGDKLFCHNDIQSINGMLYCVESYLFYVR